MSNLQPVFSQFSVHKRKRSSNDNTLDVSEPDWKRRTTSLPIRSPPRQRLTPSFTATSGTFSSFVAPITPVDTSEDESLDNDDEFSNSKLPSLSQSQNSIDNIRTTQVQVDQGDHDMEMTPSSPSQPRIGRARSNDLLSSPRRRPQFLIREVSTPTRDRIPTPISSHFDYRLAELPNAPRHSFPRLRTNLSPMVEQENWPSIGPEGLPSPAEDYEANPRIHDPDAMLYDQTSDGMSGLRVDDMDADHPLSGSTDRLRHGLGLDGLSSSTQGYGVVSGHARQQSQGNRTARLHMGHLAGCEKCAQKVPGHYSHILWS
jgi:hypothetical protein